MKKILFVVLIVSLFLSCDLFNQHHSAFLENQGKKINEYPDWCSFYTFNKVKTTEGSGVISFGYSNWKDWQSDEGKKLHHLIDDNIVSDDFSGKYRIISLGQELIIGFSDAKSSHADFFQYIGDYKDFYKDRVVHIDVNSDSVEYDCWFRSGRGYSKFTDVCNDSNKAKVILNKIDEKSYIYSLTINGSEIINAVLKNCLYGYEKAEICQNYSWLPSGFKEVIGVNRLKNGYYGQDSIDFYNDNNSISINRILTDTMYCFEGISFRSVDETEKKISFWLEDRDESDFADYIEIHITKEDWNDEPDRLADESNRHIMKGTFGFYKEGNLTPIRFYDEEHSEFSRNVLDRN